VRRHERDRTAALYQAIRAALRRRRDRIGRRLKEAVMACSFDERLVFGLLRQHDEANAALRIVARVRRQVRRGRQG
jgi:hypothetical protein